MQLREVKDDQERRIAALERRNLELETDLQQSNNRCKQLAEKSGKITEQDDQLRKIQHEFGILQSQKEDLERQVSKIQDAKIDIERRNESLRREIDLLNQDKAFAGRENTNLEDKVKRLEDKLDRTELSLLDAKKQAEKYMDRVLSANDDVKSKFEIQYSKEIEELKDRQTKEL